MSLITVKDHVMILTCHMHLILGDLILNSIFHLMDVQITNLETAQDGDTNSPLIEAILRNLTVETIILPMDPKLIHNILYHRFKINSVSQMGKVEKIKASKISIFIIKEIMKKSTETKKGSFHGTKNPILTIVTRRMLRVLIFLRKFVQWNTLQSHHIIITTAIKVTAVIVKAQTT